MDTVTDVDLLQNQAKSHLLLHFTSLGSYEDSDIPIITHGEGCWVYDARGNRYFDAYSGLCCTQVGYSHGAEMGEAAARQMEELPFYTNWGFAHPRAIELSAKVAELSPDGLNRTFFVSGGSEANEAAIKLIREYHRLNGEPDRYKMLARRTAYHGTTMGALSLTGIAAIRAPFEPLLPGVRHISNTNPYRRPDGESEQEFTTYLRDELRAVIEQEGPSSVAAVFIEPVQNAGGTITPPQGYVQAMREICSEYGILLVADEVICGFGRLGHWFGSERFGLEPDLITFAKGIGSAHVPIGGLIMSDKVAAPFLETPNMFTHGITYGGHPVVAAVALKNLEIIERLGLLQNVRDNEAHFRAMLDRLGEKPIVGDVRGVGYFMSMELVKDKETKETFNARECDELLSGYLTPRLLEAGIICRADDRGDPVVTLSPPLVAGREDLEYICDVLDTVLDDAWRKLGSLRV